MAFTNDPIPLDRVPRLSDDAFVPVDRRYLRVRLTGTAITAVVVVIVAFVASIWIDGSVAAGLGVLLVAVLAGSAIVAAVEVRRLAYQLRDHDVSLRNGVITHRTQTLPFSRVQHVNLTRGPVERAVGLASLEITSAGP
ncbi:MAG: PH domain-containing protein, partial [Ilumatobacter sp.]